ncbi:hypothetical protein I4F81_007871 [Pyropia yezoensis]|uniref:Uncharacterized protein n=1 Tax=Pyropia yezoensis TaxID=2788 RepID=A0ACC3C6E8_PYRYE|nr:hypothetical protein I4F81_007871 [Neopyropia yezoensis]
MASPPRGGHGAWPPSTTMAAAAAAAAAAAPCGRPAAAQGLTATPSWRPSWAPAPARPSSARSPVPWVDASASAAALAADGRGCPRGRRRPRSVCVGTDVAAGAELDEDLQWALPLGLRGGGPSGGG